MSGAYANFFKASSPHARESFLEDGSPAPAASVQYDIGPKHTGPIATLANYINVSRVVTKQQSKKMKVLKDAGPLKFNDIVNEQRYLIQTAWVTLKTKLNPSDVGELPHKIDRFINELGATIEDDGRLENILASIASYIAIFARLTHRFQATTVVEPQWNVALLNKEANRCVGQVSYYLQYRGGEWSQWADG